MDSIVDFVLAPIGMFSGKPLAGSIMRIVHDMQEHFRSARPAVSTRKRFESPLVLTIGQ